MKKIPKNHADNQKSRNDRNDCNEEERKSIPAIHGNTIETLR